MQEARDIYLLAKDGPDEPSSDILIDLLIGVTKGLEFELSSLSRYDRPSDRSFFDQEPAIRREGYELFLLETRQPERAVTEPKFHDPKFRIERDSP